MNFEMNGMQPFSVLFLDDGRTLAAGDMEGNLMMWDLETGEAKFRTKAHSAQINALTLAHDGQAFASCAHDGSVRIWYAGPKLENGDQK
jgi:WD40 repeat protein